VEQIASGCTQLREIELSGCTEITDASMYAIAKYVGRQLHSIALVGYAVFLFLKEKESI
jgi:hypothetical protein